MNGRNRSGNTRSRFNNILPENDVTGVDKESTLVLYQLGQSNYYCNEMNQKSIDCYVR